MNPLSVDQTTARRFMRRAVLLDAPVATVAAAIRHHGYIQIDPINITGRMHDLILRNRVQGYREGDLMRHLHGDSKVLRAGQRTAFEHHLPMAHTLVAFPLEAWPYLQAEMQARSRRHGAWAGKLSPRQRELAPGILAKIATRGPLSSEDFADTGRSRHVWGAATQAKATLQKLFFHGRLLIARRGADNRRYYDLPEHILPPAILRKKAASPTETARWEVLLKLRQRRLVLLKKREFPLVADLVQAVQVKSGPLLHCLRSDLPLLELSALSPQLSTSVQPLHLLAPLDPLIYDRRVTSALWNFDYTWEVYTPPAKRVRGYYALPILSGIELVGHVDPKAHRDVRKLRVVSRSVRRGHKVSPALRALAAWLGLR